MRLTFDKLYGEIVALMTYCATGNVDYLSSIECANRFKNILEIIKEYKDIEDELGVDLIKLMRGLLDGFYFKKKGVIYHSSFYPYPKWLVRRKQTLLRECCIIPTTGTFLYLVDYGITWALTKEELE